MNFKNLSNLKRHFIICKELLPSCMNEFYKTILLKRNFISTIKSQEAIKNGEIVETHDCPSPGGIWHIEDKKQPMCKL